MSLLRLIGNTIRVTAYALYLCLYWPARILGHPLAIIPWAALTIYLINHHQGGNPYHGNQMVYVGVVGWTFFYIGYRTVKRPPPLVLFRAPAPPPPPPPIASTARARADDPDEATVIGRLDPKLRDILRQKAGGPAS